jgi:hypothetical protein
MLAADLRLSEVVMTLELLAKDPDSGRTGCPSVYDEGNGVGVVWADALDSTTAAAVPNSLPGEHGVRIKMSVILAAADAYRARQAR